MNKDQLTRGSIWRFRGALGSSSVPGFPGRMATEWKRRLAALRKSDGSSAAASTNQAAPAASTLRRKPRRRSGWRFRAQARGEPVLGERDCRAGWRRQNENGRRNEGGFRERLDDLPGILLLLFRLPFRDRRAERARMIAIESRAHRLCDIRIMRATHEHARPGHRLQRKPMRAAHMERANQR
jgi:hypothetical protein